MERVDGGRHGVTPVWLTVLAEVAEANEIDLAARPGNPGRRFG